MSRFIDFIREMPRLCGAQNAERWGRVNVLQFHDEMKGDSVFSATEDDFVNPMNRVETAFGWETNCIEKKLYCKRLILLNVLSHYVNKHGKAEYQGAVDNLTTELSIEEAKQPEIAAMYSVQEARLGGWEP